MTSITWKKPVLIYHTSSISYDETERLRDMPGIYFFSRTYGAGDYEPFYVGKTMHVRKRLEQYRCSSGKHETRIRAVIEGKADRHTGITLSSGPRYFHFGYVDPKSGQSADKVIARAERALIQYGLIVGWTLINNQLAGEAATRRFEINGSRYGRLLPQTLIAHK